MQTINYKEKFPMYVAHPDLIYLDSAATSLTPQIVLDKMNDYYTQYGTNISRGVYSLCEEATTQYELVREKAAAFIHAPSDQEIIFTTGTTHSLNILAHGISPDESDMHILATAMDHHANFVPWQNRTKNFEVINIDKDYRLDLSNLAKKITSKTAVLTIPLISNVLGTINPVQKIISLAREINPQIIVVIDAAQAAPHIPIDVQKLDCDFLTFSAHKLYGPTGAGILWGKKEKLQNIRPLLTGGDMISEVSSSKTQYRNIPHKLEAGTPNIAGIIGLGAAIDFIQSIGLKKIQKNEEMLTKYALNSLRKISGLKIYGPQDANDRAGVVSFTLKNIHPHDIASILDTQYNIAVRAGNHCAMPLHIETLDIPATARISFGIYNTIEDIDTLEKGLYKVSEIFS